MSFARVLSVAVLIGHIGFGVANAQSQMKTEIPAEFPPASFNGSQYVDSRGCVYIRAGIDGNVTWVPRMTRARQHICNARPTFASAPAPQPQQTAAASTATVLPPPADAPKPKPAAAPAPAPKPQPASRPAPRVVTAQPAPAPEPVRVAPPAPQRVTVSSAPRPVSIAPAPAPVRQVAVPARKVGTVRAPVAPSTATGCRWASPQSAQYMRGKGVRCGPQAVSPVSSAPVPAGRGAGTRVATGPQAIRIAPGTRVAPLHVARMQQAAHVTGPVPEGYRLVWEDDRLNPHRAHQTLEGKRMMDLRWTRDVPRRLIDMSTGRDVTVFNPDLVYPYTSMEQQQMAPGSPARVSTKGQAVAAQPRMSTRSAPRAPRSGGNDKALRVASGHRYVQVGSYPSDTAARADAARLIRAGLTVRMGTLHRGGNTARVLLAGPYGSPQSLGNALHAARRAGFPAAVTRE